MTQQKVNFQFFLLIAFVGTLLVSLVPAYANRPQDIFFNDVLIRARLAEVLDVDINTIPAHAINEYRLGACARMSEGDLYLTLKHEQYCKSLIHKSQPSGTQSISPKDAEGMCMDAKDFEGCMRVNAGQISKN